jgi:hypothetical protein
MTNLRLNKKRKERHRGGRNGLAVYLSLLALQPMAAE